MICIYDMWIIVEFQQNKISWIILNNSINQTLLEEPIIFKLIQKKHFFLFIVNQKQKNKRKSYFFDDYDIYHFDLYKFFKSYWDWLS